MRLIGKLAACLAVLLGADRAYAEDTACFGADFIDGAQLEIGRVKTGAPRVNFVRNGKSDLACPSASDACRDRAFVVPGDLVVMGRRLREFICADYLTPKSARSGWLPLAQIEPAPKVVAPEDWIGDWRRVEADIKISWRPAGGLSIDAGATYGALDPDRIKRGAVNEGDISGALQFADGAASYADKDTDATNPDDFGCRLRMTRAGTFLFVQDNGQCGGVNVSFTGLYRRAKE